MPGYPCPVVSDQAVRCTARGGCTTHPAVLVLRWRTWRAVPGAAEPVAQSGGRPPAPVSALLPATLWVQRTLAAAEGRVACVSGCGAAPDPESCIVAVQFDGQGRNTSHVQVVLRGVPADTHQAGLGSGRDIHAVPPATGPEPSRAPGRSVPGKWDASGTAGRLVGAMAARMMRLRRRGDEAGDSRPGPHTVHGSLSVTPAS